MDATAAEFGERTAAEWGDRIARFAEVECRGSSRLYETLGLELAKDHDLLEWLAAKAGPRANANLIFAAVHYLLLGGPLLAETRDAGLAAFYPSLMDAALPPAGAFPAFKAFCERERPALEQLLATRTTQTNEVARCTYLLPAFVRAATLSGKPLSFIDVGTAAGLNLLFDRYEYNYGGGQFAGPEWATVNLRTELRGAPVDVGRILSINGRVGVDLAPINPADRDATLWLEACIWPEHTDRLRNLRAALEIARREKPRVVAGNAIDLVPDLAEEVSSNAALVIFNTNVLPYFSPQEEAAYGEVLAEIGAKRELFWIAAEAPPLARAAGFTASFQGITPVPGAIPLVMSHFVDGHRDDRVLALTAPHARWLDWFES